MAKRNVEPAAQDRKAVARARARTPNRDEDGEIFPADVTPREREILVAIRRVVGMSFEEETRLLEELQPFVGESPATDTTAPSDTVRWAAEQVVNAVVAARSKGWTVTLENAGGSADAGRNPQARALNVALAELAVAVDAYDEEGLRIHERKLAAAAPATAEVSHEGDDVIFSIAGLVDVLAERLHANGSLGVGHDHALFNLLERECKRAVGAA